MILERQNHAENNETSTNFKILGLSEIRLTENGVRRMSTRNSFLLW